MEPAGNPSRPTADGFHDGVEILEPQGLFHPALDYRDDVGLVTVAVQVRDGYTNQWKALAVTSARKATIVEDMIPCDGEIALSGRPLAIPSLARWRYADIRRFCAGEHVEPAAVFERVRSLHLKYFDYPAAGAADVLALWSIGTYLFPLFPAYPYIELNAPRNSGKSKQLHFTSRLAFNGRLIVRPTEASTFRLIQDTRGTICFDEAETFGTDQRGELLQILNAGYAAGGIVTRCTGNELREYELYGPKMFASIRGLPTTTATRCVRIQMLRTHDRLRGDLAVTADGEDWDGIRHEIYSFALDAFRAVRELYQHENFCAFMNRDNEKWRPLLTLAHYLESQGVQGLAERTSAFAETAVAQSTESGLPPFDDAVLSVLYKLTARQPVVVSPTRILKLLQGHDGNGWNRETAQGVGYVLRRLGFRREASRRMASRYTITRADVMDIANRYDVPLDSV